MSATDSQTLALFLRFSESLATVVMHSFAPFEQICPVPRTPHVEVKSPQRHLALDEKLVESHGMRVVEVDEVGAEVVDEEPQLERFGMYLFAGNCPCWRRDRYSWLDVDNVVFAKSVCPDLVA